MKSRSVKIKNSCFRVGIIKEFSCKLQLEMEYRFAAVYFNIDYFFSLFFRLINKFNYNLSDGLVTGRKINLLKDGK